MDRFIAKMFSSVNFSLLIFKIQYGQIYRLYFLVSRQNLTRPLKSNMDRFIGFDTVELRINVTTLKSNMDRFIGYVEL